MGKSFNIRFICKHDSHGTPLNLFDVLTQIIGDCVVENGGCVFDNRSDTSAVKTYHLTDRHFSSFQLLQKVQSFGCLFDDIINMTIPFNVDPNSQS